MRLMSSLKSSSQPGGHAQVAHGDASAAASQSDAHGLLADPRPEVLVEVEQVPDQPGQPREAVGQDRILGAGDARLVDALGVVDGLGERRRQGLDEHARLQTVGPVGADVPGELAGAQREADQRRVVQVELGQQPVEVGRERVEVIALGRAARGAEAAPVVGDDPVAGREQRVHLRLPGPAVQRPAGEEHDGGAAAVVLVVQLDRRGVLLPCDDDRHGAS